MYSFYAQRTAIYRQSRNGSYVRLAWQGSSFLPPFLLTTVAVSIVIKRQVTHLAELNAASDTLPDSHPLLCSQRRLVVNLGIFIRSFVVAVIFRLFPPTM